MYAYTVLENKNKSYKCKICNDGKSSLMFTLFTTQCLSFNSKKKIPWSVGLKMKLQRDDDASCNINFLQKLWGVGQHVLTRSAAVKML